MIAGAWKPLRARILGCSQCFPEGGNRPVIDELGDARAMVVGQAPSRTDEESRRPFTGPGGRRLRAWLRDAGLGDEDVYFSALTKCYPGRGSAGKGDRAPAKSELAACRPFLVSELRLVRPRIVLPVGGLAIRALLSQNRLSDCVGNAYRAEDCPGYAALTGDAHSDAWIVPLPHCSGASLWLNHPENVRLLERAIRHVSSLVTRGEPLD